MVHASPNALILLRGEPKLGDVNSIMMVMMMMVLL